MPPPDPGVIVEGAAAPERLAASVRFLDACVVGTVDHSGLVSPVIFAIAEFERPGRGSYHWLASWGAFPSHVSLMVSRGVME